MHLRLYLTSWLLLFSWLLAFGQELPVLPKPQKVVTASGKFTLSSNFQLEVPYADSALRAQLNEWLTTEVHPERYTGKTIQTKISVQLNGPKKWKGYLKKLQLDDSFNPGEEGYVLQVEQNQIMLLATSGKGLFYGFQTLRQLFRMPSIPCVTIYDKPLIAKRAWQDDISRGPIPTLEYLKKEIRILSHYKLNYFTLYTEHVLKHPKYPQIAPEQGISTAEIKALTAYAAAYHVELIANQQSFGHMEHVLKYPEYAHLAENTHVLNPALEATYSLLGDLLKNADQSYKGKYFHLNADETFGLGYGPAKAMVDSLGVGRTYLAHLNRSVQLIADGGKQPMVWADILQNHPELLSQLPPNLLLVPWAYHAADDFSEWLKPVAKSGHTFWVAPGISNWNNLLPDLSTTRINCHNLIRDGYLNGAEGVLLTTWDDDGHALFENNYPGLIWGADLCWNPSLDKVSVARWQRFEKALDIQYWQCEMTSLYTSILQTAKASGIPILNNGKLFDAFYPLFPGEVSTDACANIAQSLQQTELLIDQSNYQLLHTGISAEAIQTWRLALDQLKFSLMKSRLRCHYQQMLAGGYDKSLVKEELKILLADLERMRIAFTECYRSEAREWYLKENLQRYDALASDLQNLYQYCRIEPAAALTGGKRTITITAPLSDMPVYYRTYSTASWQQYRKPIRTNKNIRVDARTGPAENNAVQTDTFVFHSAIGSIKALSPHPSSYHPAYQAGGLQALTDGRTAPDLNLKRGYWQGFSGTDLVLYMEPATTKKVSSLEISFYQCTPQWVILPRSLMLMASDDGYEFREICNLSHQVPVNIPDMVKYTFTTSFPAVNAKYYKVVAKYAGPLPDGHPGAGNQSMLFADELILR